MMDANEKEITFQKVLLSMLAALSKFPVKL